MGLGLSKDFIVFVVISIVIGIGTGNWKSGVLFFGFYGVIKIIWKLLT